MFITFLGNRHCNLCGLYFKRDRDRDRLNEPFESTQRDLAYSPGVLAEDLTLTTRQRSFP